MLCVIAYAHIELDNDLNPYMNLKTPPPKTIHQTPLPNTNKIIACYYSVFRFILKMQEI
jgi:hypothetical protein